MVLQIRYKAHEMHIYSRTEYCILYTVYKIHILKRSYVNGLINCKKSDNMGWKKVTLRKEKLAHCHRSNA
jgi:hypothetical protein